MLITPKLSDETRIPTAIFKKTLYFIGLCSNMTKNSKTTPPRALFVTVYLYVKWALKPEEVQICAL